MFFSSFLVLRLGAHGSCFDRWGPSCILHPQHHSDLQQYTPTLKFSYWEHMIQPLTSWEHIIQPSTSWEHMIQPSTSWEPGSQSVHESHNKQVAWVWHMNNLVFCFHKRAKRASSISGEHPCQVTTWYIQFPKSYHVHKVADDACPPRQRQ